MKLAEKLVYAKRAIEFITQHDDATLQERAVLVDALQSFLSSELVAAKKRSEAKAKAQVAAMKKVAGAKKVAADDVGMSEPKRTKRELATPKRAAKH